MSGSMEVAVARALARVDEAIGLIGAAVPADWTGQAATAYEARRAEAAVSADTLRRGTAAILPVARAADAEAATWRAVGGVLA